MNGESNTYAGYFTYDEMTGLLRALAETFPQLIQLDSCGESLEGRAIWVATVTNRASGAPESKPALYIDANIHAGEPAGSAACLYTIHYLCSQYGQDEAVSRLLDHRTIYILPRTNPDGTERYLTTPSDQWGSMRPYPEGVVWDGLERCDIDGDGEILLMRLVDPNGEWKVSDQDPRLMVPRLPHEFGGTYYRLYSEGELVGEKASPADLPALPRTYQLNLNRNFPAGWNIEAFQPGGGAYPLSEPECKAVAEFIMAHPNIGAVFAYHTFSGVYLRPSCYKPDEQLPPRDILAYEQLAAVTKSYTGYDTVSTYHNFTRDKARPRRGSLTDWTYEHLGLYSIVAELWSMADHAGVRRHPTDYYPHQPRPESDELLCLQWNDRELGGEGFKPWTPFEHHQLGRVEIGGWRIKFTQKNPPPQFMPAEAHKNMLASLAVAGALPELQIKEIKATPLRSGLVEVAVVVENAGFLPTHVMALAQQINVAKPVTLSIKLPVGCELVGGSPTKSLGHLEGRLRSNSNHYFGDPGEEVPRKTATARWTVRLPGSAAELAATIEAASPRAGVVRASVQLSE